MDRAGGSSFTEFLASHSPELLPEFLRRMPEAGDGPGIELEHGTTIVAATCAEGVVLAGDRRATMGSMIAKRDVRKIFRTDDYSAAGVAGAWSIAVAMMRLFQVELEHYEKLEERPLSLIGKANRLAAMVKGNLGAAMQGFVVVPLFVGFDEDARKGRIFSYDPVGGPTEERRFHSVGSGSIFATGSLKKLYTDNMSVDDAVLAAVQGAKLETLSAEVAMVPKNLTPLEGKNAAGMMRMIEALEEHDDVQNVYTNFEGGDDEE